MDLKEHCQSCGGRLNDSEFFTQTHDCSRKITDKEWARDLAYRLDGVIEFYLDASRPQKTLPLFVIKAQELLARYNAEKSPTILTSKE